MNRKAFDVVAGSLQINPFNPESAKVALSKMALGDLQNVLHWSSGRLRWLWHRWRSHGFERRWTWTYCADGFISWLLGTDTLADGKEGFEFVVVSFGDVTGLDVVGYLPGADVKGCGVADSAN